MHHQSFDPVSRSLDHPHDVVVDGSFDVPRSRRE